MKRLLPIFLFAALLLGTLPAGAQAADTVLRANGCQVRVRFYNLDAETRPIMDEWLRRLPNENAPEYIEDFNEAWKAIGKSVKLHLEEYEWGADHQTDVKSVTCRNGMTVVFQYPKVMQRYYPGEDVAIFSNGDGIVSIDLRTGEDTPDPHYMAYSPDGMFRFGGWFRITTCDSELILQTFDNSAREYKTIVSLRDVLDCYMSELGEAVEENYQFGEPRYLLRCFWHEGSLYIGSPDYNEWCRVDIKTKR